MMRIEEAVEEVDVGVVVDGEVGADEVVVVEEEVEEGVIPEVVHPQVHGMGLVRQSHHI